jgi:hypothetical protein
MKVMNQVLEHLGIKANQLAHNIGLNRAQAIYDVLNPNKNVGISKKMAERIVEKYPQINKTYLLMGEGEMLKNDTNIKYIAPYINEELSGVPYVSASVAATFIENLYSMEYDLETYGVRAEDGEILTNGEYIVFDVIGESMTPTIPGGAKILCRKIKEEQWEYANGVVVVIYGKTLTVKRILKNDLYNRNALTLKADNPIHGEVTVQHSEIRAMWQAIRIISMKIS